MGKTNTLPRECLAEVVGTFILVFFGVGAVHAAVLTGAQAGIWQVAVVWAVAISLAIYAVGAISGAHINPAITLAFTAFGGFPLRKAPFYIASQVAGAVLGAAVLYGLFGNILREFESAAGIVRGGPGSELSAMVYGEYFPNPAIARGMKWAPDAVSPLQAMLAEGIGTAFLAFFVFAVTDSRNARRPGRTLTPVCIGLAVAVIISIVAPLTQAGLNPARDFGPRLFSYFAGWGAVAIPGPRGGWFTVYILSPILGSLAGSAIYQFLIRPSLALEKPAGPAKAASEERSMRTVRLVLVGGFLGAGKTTLLWSAARRLAAQGRRVGLITNDQAPLLVDTGLLAGEGLSVQEVAGSCFCCNFPGLLRAAETLKNEIDADVLLAEPVGSCTDLSATILQPLKDKFAQQFVLAPLSVLTDPIRLKDVLAGRPLAMHDSAAYIFRKQLEEADLIVLNKTDLLPADELADLRRLVAGRFPGATVRCLSAQEGTGVDDWLAEVLGGGPAGTKIAEVDYDTYAEGEAVLGWLNASADLTAPGGEAGWPTFCVRLMSGLQEAFRQGRAEVGHVKALVSSDAGRYVANLTRTDDRVQLRGRMDGSPKQARLILNARVQMPPQDLEVIVRRELAEAAGASIAVRLDHLHCLSPGRPHPTYRYTHIT